MFDFLAILGFLIPFCALSLFSNKVELSCDSETFRLWQSFTTTVAQDYRLITCSSL